MAAEVAARLTVHCLTYTRLIHLYLISLALTPFFEPWCSHSLLRALQPNMSASLPGNRDLPASQYDLSTYWGRVKQSAQIADPRWARMGGCQEDCCVQPIRNVLCNGAEGPAT